MRSAAEVIKGDKEIMRSEPKARIELFSMHLVITCCKAQVRATKSAKLSNHLSDNCRLLVLNLLLKTKVAPDNVPCLQIYACSSWKLFQYLRY